MTKFYSLLCLLALLATGCTAADDRDIDVGVPPQDAGIVVAVVDGSFAGPKLGSSYPTPTDSGVPIVVNGHYLPAALGCANGQVLGWSGGAPACVSASGVAFAIDLATADGGENVIGWQGRPITDAGPDAESVWYWSVDAGAWKQASPSDAGLVLTSTDAGVLAWLAPSGGTTTTFAGDLVLADAGVQNVIGWENQPLWGDAGATEGELSYFGDAGAWTLLGAGTIGQFLKSGGTTGAPSWANTSTIFTPGGSIAGSATSQTVVQIDGPSPGSGIIPIGINAANMQWAAGTPSPTLSIVAQDAGAAGAQALTIQGENNTFDGGTGGSVVINSGSGTTPGPALLEVGGTIVEQLGKATTDFVTMGANPATSGYVRVGGNVANIIVHRNAGNSVDQTVSWQGSDANLYYGDQTNWSSVNLICSSTVNLYVGGTPRLFLSSTLASLNVPLGGDANNSVPFTFNRIGTAIGLSGSGGTTTLSAAQYVNPILAFTGTMTAAQTVVLPNKAGDWKIDVSALVLSGQTLTLQSGSATTAWSTLSTNLQIAECITTGANTIACNH